MLVVTAEIRRDEPRHARTAARIRPRRGARRPLPSRAWIVVLVPALCIALAGWSHRWVTEDAFIDFRVVGNILSGHGPVFNVGERVEVYTDPLWVAILTVFRGLVPIVPIEWWSVVLGLASTVLGFVLGGRAAQRLGTALGASFVLPVGMLVASSVAGLWDFATSGLETGLVFGWEGLCWWMLVRVLELRRRASSTAFVIGLGPLIRPDLALISIVMLAALATVVGRRTWEGPRGTWRRWGLPVVSAAALPIGYEVFRMVYFAMVVPNTALAKSAGSSWWSQGLKYLSNFNAPYFLWVPLACLLPFTVERLVRLWRSRELTAAAVLAAPLLGGILDAGYVTSIGGDFMHARMLLPGFFAAALTLWVEPHSRVSWKVVPALAAIVWALVCLVALRPPAATLQAEKGIVNERSVWQQVSGTGNPIMLSDYIPWLRYPSHPGPSGPLRLYQITGVMMNRLAQNGDPALRHARNIMAVGTNAAAPAAFIATDSTMPAKVITFSPNIGIFGLAAGSQVCIFDTYSIANPIGSHTTVHHRGRPGHEKLIGLSWMIARFTPPGTAIPASAQVSASEVADARAALNCEPLHSYLRAITAPLSFDRMMSNFSEALGFSTMSFDSDPSIARRQLCGTSDAGR